MVRTAFAGAKVQRNFGIGEVLFASCCFTAKKQTINPLERILLIISYYIKKQTINSYFARSAQTIIACCFKKKRQPAYGIAA